MPATYARPDSAMPRAQLGIVPVAGVQQRHLARKPSLTRPADLLQRDLRLGLEADLRRHTRLAPTLVISSPILRQIQPTGHRQACIMVGDRQCHRYLAV